MCPLTPQGDAFIDKIFEKVFEDVIQPARTFSVGHKSRKFIFLSFFFSLLMFLVIYSPTSILYYAFQ